MFAGEKKGMAASEIGDLLVDDHGDLESAGRATRRSRRSSINWTIPRLLSEKRLDRIMFKALGMQPRARQT